ncbi:MAG: HAD-IIIA family hydrolase [Mariprofundales bacterium]|nr:HAD-IIIA family hydrolase [Mariprofundales bacterium]
MILDRDGVINHDSPDYILSAAAWIPIPGSLEAMAQLHQQGVPVTVASNQSAVGRGYISGDQFAAIRARMEQMVAQHGGKLTMQAYCFHRPDQGCGCRKPKPGLLQQILTELNCAPQHAIMIGDSPRDMEAALAIGVRPILVASGYHDFHQVKQQVHALDPTIPHYADLAAATNALLP